MKTTLGVTLWAIEDLHEGNTVPDLQKGVKAIFSEKELADQVADTFNSMSGEERFKVISAQLWKTEVIELLLDDTLPF